MKKYLDKDLFKKHKKIMVINSIVMFIALFILMNNVNMIKAVNLNELTIKENVISRYFSMNFISSLVLFLLYGVLMVLLFKDKKQEFNEIEQGNYTKVQWFFTKIISSYISIFIAIILNVIIKLLLYKKFYSIYHEDLGIQVSNIFMFFLFQCMFALCSLNILIFSNIIFGDLLIATTFPVIIAEFIVTTFGINTLFISNRFNFIRILINPIKNNVVDPLIYALYWDGRLELQESLLQRLFLLFTFIIALVSFFLAYLALEKLDEKKVQKKYPYTSARVIFHVILASIIGFYLPAGIAYTLALTKRSIDLELAKYVFNIFAIILIPTFYLLLFIWSKEKSGYVKLNE
jgi:hypothetical protein